MRLPISFSASLLLVTTAKCVVGFDLLQTLSNVVDDGRKNIEKVVSGVSEWDLGLDIPAILDEGRKTLDNVFDGISHLDIPALLSDIVPEESKNALKDIEREVAAIVVATGAVLTEFQQHGSSTEEFHLHMQAFLEEIRVIVEAHFPPLDSAPGHEERQRMANEFIERIRGPFVSVAKKLGIPPDDADALWTKLSSPVAHVVVLLFDFYELHPHISHILISIVVWKSIPDEKTILRFLGFGKDGPIQGTMATWIQKQFYSYGIPQGSLFSRLQSIAMKIARPIILKAKL